MQDLCVKRSRGKHILDETGRRCSSSQKNIAGHLPRGPFTRKADAPGSIALGSSLRTRSRCFLRRQIFWRSLNLTFLRLPGPVAWRSVDAAAPCGAGQAAATFCIPLQTPPTRSAACTQSGSRFLLQRAEKWQGHDATVRLSGHSSLALPNITAPAPRPDGRGTGRQAMVSPSRSAASAPRRPWPLPHRSESRLFDSLS